jgi:predicted nucleotidyltransferase
MLEKYNINQTTLKILAVYRSDYRRSSHLREIAKETAVDVSPIHYQLERLEKMRVLFSALKGRNKEYSLNLGNLSVKYYMTLAETYTTVTYLEWNFLIKKITGELEAQIDGVIILFGSFAKGRATKNSDVDLFIVSEDESSLSGRAVREVQDLVGRKINVKSMNKAGFIKGFSNGDPLIREVVSDHVILKGIDEFCDMMWHIHARP